MAMPKGRATAFKKANDLYQESASGSLAEKRAVTLLIETSHNLVQMAETHSRASGINARLGEVAARKRVRMCLQAMRSARTITKLLMASEQRPYLTVEINKEIEDVYKEKLAKLREKHNKANR